MNNLKNYTTFINESKDKTKDISKEVSKDIKPGKILVVVGPPGSGKGTLAKELERKFGLIHISTGELIRNSDDLELKELVKDGSFVSDNMMVKILRAKLKNIDMNKGVVLDGFPRTIKQAKKLDGLLGRLGFGLNNVIYLDLPEEISKKRIKSRAEKENRDDDKKDETVQNRFDEYYSKTFPIVEYYKLSHKLIKVDANLGKASVLDTVSKKLKLK